MACFLTAVPNAQNVEAQVGMRFMARILIICEDEPFRLSLEKTLVKVGHRVEALSGLAALEEAPLARTFDLIILDIASGTRAGEAALKRIQERCPDCRVLVTSPFQGRQWDGILVRGRAADFLERPVKREVLLERIRGLVATTDVPESPV